MFLNVFEKGLGQRVWHNPIQENT